MDDEQNVDAGSETSGEQAADESSQEQPSEASQDAAQDAGGAADAEVNSSETSGEQAVPNPNESRTAFVKNARPGDVCRCPDGRTGTVHRFDEGLVCIPNAVQG